MSHTRDSGNEKRVVSNSQARPKAFALHVNSGDGRIDEREEKRERVTLAGAISRRELAKRETDDLSAVIYSAIAAW